MVVRRPRTVRSEEGLTSHVDGRILEMPSGRKWTLIRLPIAYAHEAGASRTVRVEFDLVVLEAHLGVRRQLRCRDVRCWVEGHRVEMAGPTTAHIRRVVDSRLAAEEARRTHSRLPRT